MITKSQRVKVTFISIQACVKSCYKAVGTFCLFDALYSCFSVLLRVILFFWLPDTPSYRTPCSITPVSSCIVKYWRAFRPMVMGILWNISSSAHLYSSLIGPDFPTLREWCVANIYCIVVFSWDSSIGVVAFHTHSPQYLFLCFSVWLSTYFSWLG